MKQEIVHIAIVVKEYDEAIEFYTKKLNFELIEDTYAHHRPDHILSFTIGPENSPCL
jgi:catechol 2,3-dioxygenase-like lactoylglutathione lyase family enzyme